MKSFRLEYLKIFIFLVVVLLFVLLLFLVPFFLNNRKYRISRHTPVECGCEPLGSGKSRVEINYYVVSILFIIFEVEFVTLIPWILKFNFSFSTALWPVYVFFLFLIVGLLYEYLRGAVGD
jgi:NADH-quinone oxidoreductase subunit A